MFDLPRIGLPTFKVIVNDLLCKRDKRQQYRFPKSKKKRIRKKWSKRQANFKYVPDDVVFLAGNILYVSQRVFKAWETHLKNKEPKYLEPEWLKTLAWFELETKIKLFRDFKI